MARFSSQKFKILAVVKLMHLANISRDRYRIMINYILTSITRYYKGEICDGDRLFLFDSYLRILFLQTLQKWLHSKDECFVFSPVKVISVD